MNCGVGSRLGSDPAWPAAIAPIQPLAWELPYAAGAALKRPHTKEDVVHVYNGILLSHKKE